MEGPEPTPTPGEMDAGFQSPPDAAPEELPAPPAEEMAMPPPEPEPVAAEPTRTPTPSASKRSYIVVKGDSLWLIAGKPLAFSDSFRWPLIFKANRKKIIDPDLIEPGQKLSWKLSYAIPEIEDAVQKAKDTPKYVPHFSVRKSLPISY